MADPVEVAHDRDVAGGAEVVLDEPTRRLLHEPLARARTVEDQVGLAVAIEVALERDIEGARAEGVRAAGRGDAPGDERVEHARVDAIEDRQVGKAGAGVVALDRHERDGQRPARRTLIAGAVDQGRGVGVLAVGERSGIADRHRAAAGAENGADHHTATEQAQGRTGRNPGDVELRVPDAGDVIAQRPGVRGRLEHRRPPGRRQWCRSSGRRVRSSARCCWRDREPGRTG